MIEDDAVTRNPLSKKKRIKLAVNEPAWSSSQNFVNNLLWSHASGSMSPSLRSKDVLVVSKSARR